MARVCGRAVLGTVTKAVWEGVLRTMVRACVKREWGLYPGPFGRAGSVKVSGWVGED
jgi:hypothetical protein